MKLILLLIATAYTAYALPAGNTALDRYNYYDSTWRGFKNTMGTQLSKDANAYGKGWQRKKSIEMRKEINQMHLEVVTELKAEILAFVGSLSEQLNLTPELYSNDRIYSRHTALREYASTQAYFNELRERANVLLAIQDRYIAALHEEREALDRGEVPKLTFNEKLKKAFQKAKDSMEYARFMFSCLEFEVCYKQFTDKIEDIDRETRETLASIVFRDTNRAIEEAENNNAGFEPEKGFESKREESLKEEDFEFVQGREQMGEPKYFIPNEDEQYVEREERNTQGKKYNDFQ